MAKIEIDLDKVLLTPKGTPYKQNPADNSPDETLGNFVANVLLGMYQEDAQLPPRKKIDRAKLGERCLQGGTQGFTPDDLALINEYVGKSALPYVILQVYRLTGAEE